MIRNILYTFVADNYITTRYFAPHEIVCIVGIHVEGGRGGTLEEYNVMACNVQETIYSLQRLGVVIATIY